MLALFMQSRLARAAMLLAVWAAGTSQADERITDFR
jgi:hypothetical protein